MEVIKSWNIPYPGGVPNRREPKEYRIVRFEDGTLAFCKVDLTPEIVGHEAEILKHLDGLAFVPSLLRQEPNAIYTSYFEGKLLSTLKGRLGIWECLRVGWQILVIVRGVHRKGVVHSDIRPWNFIYGDDSRLYLIDFEYAYSHRQTELPEFLARHHVGGLKTELTDWSDACKSIATVWQGSSHPVTGSVLSCLPLVAHWAMLIMLRLKSRISSFWNRSSAKER